MHQCQRICVRRKRGFVFLDGVCATERERQKSNCHNLRRTSDPTVLVFLPRFADSRKTNEEDQKRASTGSSERKEVGVRREGAGWNNTIKNCVISALPTDWRWRKIAPAEKSRKCSVLTLEHLAPKSNQEARSAAVLEI